MPSKDPPFIPWPIARHRLRLPGPRWALCLSEEALQALQGLSKRALERLGRCLDAMEHDPYRLDAQDAQILPSRESDDRTHRIHMPPYLIEYRIAGRVVEVTRIEVYRKPFLLADHYTVAQIAEQQGWSHKRAHRWLTGYVPWRKIGRDYQAPKEVADAVMSVTDKGKKVFVPFRLFLHLYAAELPTWIEKYPPDLYTWPELAIRHVKGKT